MLSTFPALWRASRVVRIRSYGALLAATLLCVLWVGVWASLGSTYRADVRVAYLRSDGAAQKLAERSLRLLENIDQTASLVQYIASSDSFGANLKGMAEKGLLVERSWMADLSIVDHSGVVLDSTNLAPGALPEDKAALERARVQTSNALLLSPALYSDKQHKWVLAASKRMSDAGGNFTGMVSVTVDADLLTRNFPVDENPDAMIGVAGADGVYRSRQVGSEHQADIRVPAAFLRALANDANRPLVATPSPVDGVPRFLSIASVGSQGLVAVVGVSEASALAHYRQIRTRVLAAALACSLLIVGLVIGLVGLATRLSRSVSVLRRAELKLHEDKELLQVTLRSIVDAVISTDAEGRVTYLNPRAEQMTGWALRDALGQRSVDVVCVDDTSSPAQPINLVESALRTRTGQDAEGVMLSRSGMRRAVEHSVARLLDVHGELVGTVMVVHDVSNARKLVNELAYQAKHDALTGLPNRLAFDARLDRALQSAKGGQHHVLMFLDLDRFKVVNDSSGHVAGDELLRQISTRLASVLRPDDTLARLGGDEFALLLENCPLEPALRVADAVLEAVREFRFVWEEKSFRIGVSIGVVPFDSAHGSKTELKQMADTACYVAKDSGRGRAHVYAPDDAAVAKRHGELSWATRLHNAIAEDRLVLQGQRIATLGSARAGSAFELLLRLREPDGRLIPPMAFLPAAERQGLMPSIDRLVIGKAIALYARVHEQYPAPLRFHINLAAATQGSDGLIGFVSAELVKHGVAPSALVFEISESAVLANLPRAVDLVQHLRKLGCGVALDGFGGGMTSFSHLKLLQVDQLKIDGSIVRDMIRDPLSFSMVEAIHKIATQQGLETVAEFVDGDDMLQALRALGVGHVQGFGVERPRFMEEVAAPSGIAPTRSATVQLLPRQAGLR